MSITSHPSLRILPFPFLLLIASLFFISPTTAVYFDISTCSIPSCIHVTTLGSDVTGNGTLISPVRTIQRALDVAIARRTMGNPGHIKIVLDDGIYPGGIVWNGKRNSLTSRSGPSMTFIDCNMTTFGIRIDSDQDERTVISGVTIQHCKATLGGGVAVLGDETHPILKDMVIQNNTALSGAGLLVNLGYPTVINVTFQDNVARQGGAIGVVANSQLITIRDCLIMRNAAPGSFAGGMFLSLANVQIYNTTLSYNSAIMGGAFHMDSSILQMYGSTVFSNIATFDDGGGLYGIRSILEVYDSIWRGNSGYAKGGCLKIFLAYNQNRDYNKFPYDFRAVRSVFDQNIGFEEGVLNLKDFISASLEDCIISNNQCNTGILFAGANSQVILNNILFSKGQSTMGGGMYIKGSKVTCTNCTFTQNVATMDGGAVRVDAKSSLKLVDPIFISNRATATGGALACISGPCQVIGGVFDSNMANQDGGAIAVTTTTLTVNGTLFKNNNATYGGAIRTGIAATSTITASTFQSNNALCGTLYWTTPSTATTDAMLIQNTYVSGSTSYGNEFASAPASLTFFSPDDDDDVTLPSTQRSDPSFVNNRTIIMTQTIANVDPFPIRLAILDTYGQRVNIAAMSLIDVYATITPYVSNLDNSSININSTTSSIQPAIFINLDRIHMPAGIASFPLAIAGQLGASYAIDFTTSITGVAGVRMIVTIQECQELDYITYYPPGSTTYRVCRAATPKYISSAMFTVIVVVCVICIMLTATVQLSTIVFWNTPVFRGSTPSFMSLMLLGAQIGYAAIILANIDVDRTSQGMSLFTQLCRAQYWLLGLSFVLMFGTLALKTWRIKKIFCNASLSDLGTRVQTKYLYMKLGVLLAIEMLINIVFNAADPLQGTWKVNDTTYGAVCDSKSDLVYMIVMLVSKGMIAIVCVLLAYDTRNVVSAFNESKQLMIASYNMFVSIIVIVALSILIPDPVASKAIISFGTLFVITSTWVILYAPKLWICIVVSERNISATIPPASTNKNSQGSQESQRFQQQQQQQQSQKKGGKPGHAPGGPPTPGSAPVSSPGPDHHATPITNLIPTNHYRSASAGPATYALLAPTATNATATGAAAAAAAAAPLPIPQRRRQASVASVSPSGSDPTCPLNIRPRSGTGHKLDSSVSQFPVASQIQNGFIVSPSSTTNMRHLESSAATSTSTPLNGGRHSISDIELVQSGTATNTIGYNYN